jgi:hypothetical protein
MARPQPDTTTVLERPPGEATYDGDFYAWTVAQADAIREGRWDDIDWDNVAEEIESVGRNDRRAVESHLEVLFAHLLKCLVQPERWTESWDHTIRVQRKAIIQHLQRNPSLGNLPAERFARAYRHSLFLAHRDTGIGEDKFPAEPSFTLDQTLSPDCFPGPVRSRRS